ncbi:MAG: hypothetical protein AAB725_01265 [Patescibacteria group bacterium]
MMNKEILHKILPIAAIFALAVFFNFYFPTLAGIDGYYHIRHAEVYATQGIFNSDFPWLEHSVIGKWNGDIWYGFHLLLIPFTLLNNDFFGMRLAAALITFTALTGFYFIFKKFEIRWPFFWTTLLFFSAPDVNFRLLMVRPHILTFILVLALFYAFTKNKSNWLIFIFSAGISFIHLALAWLPLFVIGVVAIIKKITDGVWEIKNSTAALIGLGLGVLAHPNFISTLKIAYIQVVQLAIEKFNNIPLRFGTELKPGNHFSVVLNEILPIGLPVLITVGILIFFIKNKSIKIEKQKQIILYSSLVISIIFGLITYAVARRAADIWVGFSLIFIGLAISIIWQHIPNISSRFKKTSVIIGLTVLLGFGVNTLKFTLGYFEKMAPDTAFEKPALWLKENTEAGSIVFNIHWDNFPMLFFWNQHNHYINGMDPIFEYAFSKNLYLKHYFFDIDKILMIDGGAYTCGTNPCAQEGITTVYSALKDDFRANYVFLELPRNPKVYKYLDSDVRFKEVYNNGREIIFQVL